MIHRSRYEDLRIDEDLVKTIVIVRNYLDFPEETDKMWASLKTKDNLFDLSTIQSHQYSEEEFEALADEIKIYQMKTHWGCGSNAMYAHYLDNGVKYGIEFLTEGAPNSTIFQRLAASFPELELLVLNLPRRFETRWSFSFFECKGEQARSISMSLTELYKYFILKAAWGDQFKDPMAYDINNNSVVFLDDPEEQNYLYQTKHGIFYAASVHSIFDVEVLRKALKSAHYSKHDDGSTPTDFLYSKEKFPTIPLSEEQHHERNE